MSYRARDLRAGREVRLRRLPAAASLETSIAAARRAVALVHPHIAPVLEAGSHAGRAYVVYGETEDAPIEDAALSLREAVGLVRDAATAVAHACGRGIAHPGLHPACLRRTRTGRAVVAGYERSESGGAAPFRAPEVRAGGPVEPPANVYSLGAVLYALAVGRAPDPDGVVAPCRANPLVPGEIEALLLRSLDADPARRPGASAFAAELARWLDGPGAPADLGPTASTPLWRRAWEDVPRRGRVPLLAGTLLLLVLGLIGLIWGGRSAAEDDPSPRVSDGPPVLGVAAPPSPSLPPPPEPTTPAPPPPPVAPPTAALPSDPPRPASASVEPPGPSAPSPTPAPPDSPIADPMPSPPPDPAPVDRLKKAPPPPDPAPVDPPKKAPPPPDPTPVDPPKKAPPPPPEPAPPPPPPAPSQVGTIKFVHPEYGVFIRLDEKAQVAVGDELEAVREGAVVGVLKVRTLSRPEPLYPHGAAVCAVSSPDLAEGLIVRRPRR